LSKDRNSSHFRKPISLAPTTTNVPLGRRPQMQLPIRNPARYSPSKRESVRLHYFLNHATFPLPPPLVFRGCKHVSLVGDFRSMGTTMATPPVRGVCIQPGRHRCRRPVWAEPEVRSTSTLRLITSRPIFTCVIGMPAPTLTMARSHLRTPFSGQPATCGTKAPTRRPRPVLTARSWAIRQAAPDQILFMRVSHGGHRRR